MIIAWMLFTLLTLQKPQRGGQIFILVKGPRMHACSAFIGGYRLGDSVRTISLVIQHLHVDD